MRPGYRALALGVVQLFVAVAAQPNVIVVMTDDQRTDDVPHMPIVMERLVGQGMSFDRFYVSTPVCCPSRATFLSGQYAHNHGVTTHDREVGGFARWTAEGLATSALGPWMQALGYRTSFVGKYANGYPLPDQLEHVDPGWDDWFVGFTRFTRGLFYNYSLNDNGTVREFGRAAEDYRTDVEGAHTLAFIEQALDDAVPFFAVFAPFAPHSTSVTQFEGRTVATPPIPAPRHVGLLAGQTSPRPPSYDEADVSLKPPPVQAQLRISATEARRIDAYWQARVESLLAVDDWVGAFLDALAARGALDDTYVVFTSDNGFMLGEHRLPPERKTLSYEESIRQPLVIRGPGVAAGVAQPRLTSNIDLAPTILAWAGAPPRPALDGRSLVPLLDGRPVAGWRRFLLSERWFPNDTGLTYDVLLTESYKLTRWSPERADRDIMNGMDEVYDLRVDPWEIDNLAPSLSDEARGALYALADDLRACRGDACRRADAAPLPPSLVGGLPIADAVEVIGVYPSPTTGSATLDVRTRTTRLIRVDVFDTLGRRLSPRWQGQVAGEERIDLDLGALAPGLYLIRVSTRESAETVRVVRIGR